MTRKEVEKNTKGAKLCKNVFIYFSQLADQEQTIDNTSAQNAVIMEIVGGCSTKRINVKAYMNQGT